MKRHPHLWNSQLQGWVTGSDPPTVKVLAPSSWNVSGASYRSTFTVQPPSVELASRTFNELSGLLFPNHRESKAAFAQLSPKELLDCRVPHITNAPLAAAPGSRSSDMNRHYAYINHLELWDLHHELNQYSRLPRYNQPNEDNVQSDAIAAMRPCVISPVNTVFHDRFVSFSIECKSENSRVCI